MYLSIDNNCTEMRLWSDTSIVDDIIDGTNSDKVCGYHLNIKKDCCTIKTLYIPAIKNYVLTQTGCNTAVVNGLLMVTIDFNISNILSNCRGIITVGAGDINYGVDIDLNGNFTLNLPMPLTIPLTESVVINFNNNAGTVYSWDVDITFNNSVSPCAGLFTNIVAQPLVYPDGLTLEADDPLDPDDFNVLMLEPNAFDDTWTKWKDGIYCVELKGVFGEKVPYIDEITYFNDCDESIKCRLSSAIAEDCTYGHTAMMLWRALVYNNDCQTVSCNEACDMYEELSSHLEQCGQIKLEKCNC